MYTTGARERIDNSVSNKITRKEGFFPTITPLPPDQIRLDYRHSVESAVFVTCAPYFPRISFCYLLKFFYHFCVISLHNLVRVHYFTSALHPTELRTPVNEHAVHVTQK